MKIKYYIFILLFSFIFSKESHWATTRFETFWKKSFTQMGYRKPITFMPYDIKIGYLRYGGKNYYKQFTNLLSSSDDLINNPFITNDIAFPDISNAKDRTLISLQLDLFRYNFLSEINNKIDIQIGVGFKTINSIEELMFSNGDVLKPEFKEININTTFIKQWSPNFYNYIYNTIGYNEATFYKTIISNKESTGSGLGYSMGFGFDFIIPNNKKNNDLHCGLELNFSKLDFGNKRIKEPDNLNRIDSFNMETVGLVFSFGIGYGGKKTIADDAYLNVLNQNYLLASEQFKFYRKNESIIYNKNELSNIITFCDMQIPYQLYSMGLKEYYNNNLESAVDILQKINTSDNDLSYQVESLLYIISDKILNNFIAIEDDYSINYQIEYYKSIKKISTKIKFDVNKRLFDIYLQKGDLLLKNNNYEEAYEYYIYANSISNKNSHRIEIKINNVIVAILNDVYNLLQNKQNILAYEKLSFAKDISSKNNNIDFLISFIKDRMSSDQKDTIRDRMYNIIDEKRKLVETEIKKKIYLGDTYTAIINVLGPPEDEIVKKQIDNSYMMLMYSFNDLTYRLFLKDKILIDIERD